MTKKQNKPIAVDLDQLLTVQELCEILHCHPVTLCYHRRNNTGLPFMKLGRRVYYRRADVEALLANNFRGVPVAA